MRAWGSVGHYIQGPEVIQSVARYASMFGENHLYVMDAFVRQMLGDSIFSGYDQLAESTYDVVTFEGEISRARIDCVCQEAGDCHDVIVAIGGGKVIDVAKMLAEGAVALVVCPTIAATDAPTSAMSILYTDEGRMSNIVLHVKNPDLVLVDTQVIAHAPVRFLSAGIGDALSTYYEGVSNERTGHVNYVWGDTETGVATLAGKAIAHACVETLFRDGPAAVRANATGIVTPAFENVVEANVLLSGIGFENVGCSLAHGLGNAMTVVPGGERSMHGERVGFSTLSLLIAEDYASDEIEGVASLCVECGVPVTFEELCLDPSEDNLEMIARAALGAESWRASPVHFGVSGIVDILRATDALGRRMRSAA